MPRTFAPVQPVLHRQPNGPKCIQIVQNTPKYEFRVQWGGSRALVAKNLAHFVLSVVTEPNCPKCTQVVQNALKDEVRVLWGGLSGSLWNIPTRFCGTNFCTSLARFALSFVTLPNYPKCIQIVQTHWIMRLGSNGVDRVRSLRKIPTRLHGMNFCTTLARFEPSFVRQPNGTKCTQIVRNAPKHEFRSQRGQSGVFVAKNYDATSWHVLLHQFGPFCTEFCKAAKRSQMHPNSTRHTKIWV